MTKSKGKQVSKNITVQVPSTFTQEQIDALIAAALSQVNITSGASSSNAPLRPLPPLQPRRQERLYQVQRIISHRIDTTNGEFIFTVKFKGYTEPEEIPDSQCECPGLIADYLESNCIKTVYIFCRVSTKEQAESDRTSLDSQKQILIGNIHHFGTFNRTKIYSISASAYASIPKDLQTIGDFAVRGDLIMVWKVDRLSRNLSRSIEWLDDLHKRGIEIYAHHEGYTYSQNKLDFLQSIIHAEREAINIGVRGRASIQFRKNRGDTHVGTLPYGKQYEGVLNPDGSLKYKRVIDNVSELAIITRIKNSLLSADLLAQQLNTEGIRKRNRWWSSGMVRSIRNK